jgi:SulP family sulfate permease
MGSRESDAMNNRDELIRKLVQAVEARAGGDDGLRLPDYWDEAIWRRLLAGAAVLELSSGQVLVDRKEPGNDLYFLVSGMLEVSIPWANSVAITPVAAIRPGAVVGEMAFIDDHSRSASVWSRGDSTLFRLRRSDFDAFRREKPDLACDLLFAIGRILAERLRRSNSGSGSSGSASSFNTGY